MKPVSDAREQRLSLAIFDYHAMVDRGENLDLEPWLQEHAEIEDALRAYLDDLSGIGVSTPVDTTTRQYQVGEILGDYRLLEKIAEGGQGIIWKACPCQFSEVVVAIKTMNAPSHHDQEAIYRFREDARAIARMNHPHIIRTSYVGEESGRWFFVMELMKAGRCPTDWQLMQPIPGVPRSWSKRSRERSIMPIRATKA